MKIPTPRGPRLSLPAILFALFALLPFVHPAFTESAEASSSMGREGGRAIILGFDGADARTTQRMMDEGQLPNLKKLAEQGTFQPLISTDPAESASGWAAINTGLNPAKNGIPSFFGVQHMGDTPMAVPYHLGMEPRDTDGMQIPGPLGMLAKRDATTDAGILGAVVFVLFFAILAGLLRVKKAIALPLALILAGVGAYGAHQATGYVPKRPKVFANKIEADGFWKPAAEAGKDTVALYAAVSWDREGTEGARVLSGLGLPDVRPDIGEWYIYTTDEFVISTWPHGEEYSSSTGNTFHIPEKNSVMRSHLAGPVNLYEADKLRAELEAVEARRADTSIGWQESNQLRTRKEELEAQLKDYDSGSEEVRTKVDLEMVRKGADTVTLTLDGQSQDLREGEWSDWYSLEFKMNPLLSSKAVTRAKLMSIGNSDGTEPLELFINVLDIDPREPAFWQPISSPPEFAAELAEDADGPFETVGWACMTNTMKDKMLDFDTFLEDIEFTMKTREAVARGALARADWEIFFSVFSVTDRVQHIMYQFYDPLHPLYDEEAASREVTFFGEQVALKDIIPAIYRQVDRIVGWVMEDFVEEGDTLMLCADHGFSSFRRGVNLNNWLVEKGYMHLVPDIPAGKAKRPGKHLDPSIIDWSRTQAYALGLGMVFINEKGRDPNGIVEPGEKRALLERIAKDFLDTYEESPDGTRTKVGASATIMEDVYEGPYFDRLADLQLGFADNYRVSWSVAGGQIKLQKTEEGTYVAASPYEDNKNNWSGDHASNAPNVVTGIFFSNRPVNVPEEGVSVMHIAPTALSVVGAPVPAEMDKEPLRFK